MADTVYFSGKKQFLGGYRNKVTGLIYHHAKIQTLPPPWSIISKRKLVEKFHRDAQTIETRDQYQQTSRDAWTQVERVRLCLFVKDERIIYPTDKYVFADDIKKRQLAAIIIIQKYWRRWLAKREIFKRKREALAQMLREKKDMRIAAKEESEYLKRLNKRKKNPLTKADFALLFSDLKDWYTKELERLKESYSGPELKANLYFLLQREIEKIQANEQTKRNVFNDKVETVHNKFLEKAASPKKWIASKKLIPVETEDSQTARTFQSLYITISKVKLKPEDRVSALEDLKSAIEKYDCTLVRDIIDLADREIDMLRRGTKEKNLHGLRTRIQNLLWQMARQPAFNPETKNFSKMRRIDGKNPLINICCSCNQYFILPSNTVDETVGTNVLQGRSTKCKNCKYLENEGWIRKGVEAHRRILELLIASEERKKCTSSIIDLLQVGDIVFLVDKIWRSQSCLSGTTGLSNLVLSRWNPKQDWAPWNCVLITRNEANLHNKLENFKTMYDNKLMQLICMKHLEARMYFSTIPRFLPYIPDEFSHENYS